MWNTYQNINKFGKDSVNKFVKEKPFTYCDMHASKIKLSLLFTEFKDMEYFVAVIHQR